MSNWLRDNWLEALLVAILLLAIGWAAGVGLDLAALYGPQPTPSPTATVPPDPFLLETSLPPAPALTPEVDAFDGQRALGYANTQLALGPRPAGSPANEVTADFIASELGRLGWTADELRFQRFGQDLRSVIGKAGSGGNLLLLAAHLDTRPAAERDPDANKRAQPVLGANDGASGVAVLLELARALDLEKLDREVWLAFLDGETLAPERTWSYGPGMEVLLAQEGVDPAAVIVLNLVGGQDQTFYFESNSDEALRAELWQEANALGYGRWFPPEPGRTVTDATAFAELDIPVVNIIDLNYPYWHTLADTADKLSADSLERVGRVLEVFLENR